MDDKHEIRHLRVRITRRKFIRAGAMVGMAGALGLAVDSTIIEPDDPKLVQIEIPLSRLPESWDGVRIAQVSDFHYDENFSVVPIRKAIDIVNGLKADFVALTGDFVTLPFFKNYFGGRYLPPLGRKYPRGLRRIRGLTLYTNAGIGTIRLSVRFCCPPEVTLITLRRMRQTS